MRCPNCGNEIPEGFQFCGHCGHQISPEDVPQESIPPTRSDQQGEFDEDAETTLDIHAGEQIPSMESDEIAQELEFDEDAATMFDVQQAEQIPAVDPAKTDRDESPLEIKVGMEDMLTGQTLGPYRFTEKLGRGGMATVYKAYESGLDRYVAVKVMRQYLTSDPEFKTRFQREAKAIARLDHPNIMPVYGYGVEQELNYIATRYVDGGTLKEIMGQPLPLEQTVKIITGVARALGYAHQRGIVHRDAKPANVLLTSGDWPLLADFGLARMMESVTHVTQTGVGMGTPTYMSPEQGEGKDIDGRSDIYSLGIMLYEMLTGEPPFQADTPVGVVVQHITAPLPLPRKVNPDIPEAMERVILKAVAKNPEDRYQTTDELIGDMEKVLAGLPVNALSASAEEFKPRARWLWAALGVTLIAIVAISVFQFVLPKTVPSAETSETTVEPLAAVIDTSTEIPTNTVTPTSAQTDITPTDTPIPATPTSIAITTGSISGEIIMSDTSWEGHEFYIGLAPWGEEAPAYSTVLYAPSSYLLDDIEPGDYTLHVILDMDDSGEGPPTDGDVTAFYGTEEEPAQITVEAGKELTGINVTLIPAVGAPESPTIGAVAGMGSISGTVTLDGPDDTEHYIFIYVTIHGGHVPFDFVALDAPGPYTISGLSPNSYVVNAELDVNDSGPGPPRDGDWLGDANNALPIQVTADAELTGFDIVINMPVGE